MQTPEFAIVARVPKARCAIARSLRAAAVVCISLAVASAIAGVATVDPYVPLRLYEGAWNVMPKGTSTPVRLLDTCARVGRFFACQQTVNGKPGALLIFIPASPGRYHTQVVQADGAALGQPGSLSISGDHWVYLSGPDSKGIRYRTTNEFEGPDRIRYAVAHSSDGKRWIVTLAGVEKRAH